MCMHAQLLTHVQLFCDPMDCSLLGSSVHGISQANIQEQATIPSPGDLPNLGIKPTSPTLVGGYGTEVNNPPANAGDVGSIPWS